jgi:hypothetical protein
MATVKELIDLLSGLPEDYQVILSKDGEGNDYSPATLDFGIGKYHPESTWAGEMVFELDEDDEDYDPEDNEPSDAVAIFPVN